MEEDIKHKTKCQNDKCGNPFTPRTHRNKFCSRHCFMRFYRQQIKKEGFPSFLCSHCNQVTKLDFNPRENWQKWREFVCPKCGLKNLENLFVYVHEESIYHHYEIKIIE